MEFETSFLTVIEARSYLHHLLISLTISKTKTIATETKYFIITHLLKYLFRTNSLATTTMPKIMKLFRNKKIPSSLSSPNKRSSGIFRRSKSNSKNKTKASLVDITNDDAEKQLEIKPAITFSLSEDDEASDSLPSPVSDIENQLEELIGENVGNTIQVPVLVEQSSSEVVYLPSDVETASSSIVTSTSGTQTEDVSVGSDEGSKTMTFTHLEIMRNELNHMMALATKSKEINRLALTNEKLVADHANELALKDSQIAKIQDALALVEKALAQSQDELAHANAEQSRIIEILMKTQYELYELKHQSWFTPVLGYFSLN